MVVSTFAFSCFPLRQENGRIAELPFGFIFHDSGYWESFTSIKAHVSVRTLLIKHVWLTKMSELARFVYFGNHVTLHVESNVENVNFIGVSLFAPV